MSFNFISFKQVIDNKVIVSMVLGLTEENEDAYFKQQ